MIPTSNYSARYGGRVRLAILHTTEGATDVDSLGHFFQTGTKNASYHGAMDDNRYESYVNYSYASWSTLSANGFSDNAAMCCAAVAHGWTLADWQRHPHMLELAAAWVADRCIARGLPFRRLSIPEIQACRSNPNHPGGVIMHHDWTVAVEGTHSDCGTTFPFDQVLNRAQQIAGGDNMPSVDDILNHPIPDYYNPDDKTFTVGGAIAWAAANAGHAVDDAKAALAEAQACHKRIDETATSILQRWTQEDQNRTDLNTFLRALGAEVDQIKTMLGTLVQASGGQKPTGT